MKLIIVYLLLLSTAYAITPAVNDVDQHELYWTDQNQITLRMLADYNEKNEALERKWEEALSVDQQIKNLEQVGKKPPSELLSRKEKLASEMALFKEEVGRSHTEFRRSQIREEDIRSKIGFLKIKLTEKNFLSKYPKFQDCNETMPQVSLEEEVPYPGATFKGPFFGVPRDNQNGAGSCFANTAKNFLVGLSNGKSVASFLDMALQYKKKMGEAVEDGLDGGNSCLVLNEMKNIGYCPQKYGVFENGDKNLLIGALIDKKDKKYLFSSMHLIRDYIHGIDIYKNGSSPVKKEVLKQFSHILKNVRSNPNIIFPLPVARFALANEYKVREAFHFSRDKSIKISEDDFVKEYREIYKKFIPTYIRSLIDGKNLEEIFDLYKTHMSGFITKYGMSKALEHFKFVFIKYAQEDFSDPKFKEKLRNSLDFLKDLLGLKQKTDEEFIEYCEMTGFLDLSFLSSLNPVFTALKKKEINGDLLVDEKGDFVPPEDLLQLTFAPACIHEANRQIPDFEFYCYDGVDSMTSLKASGIALDEQLKVFRQKVLMSLVQGYPLGNSFATGESLGHINTIVGLRFNSESKSCEYLIRESQTGESTWQVESTIYPNIRSLVEVRRE